MGKMSATINNPLGSRGIRAIFGRMRERLHLRGKEVEALKKGDGHPDAGPVKAEASAPNAGSSRTGALLNGAAPAAAKSENSRPITEPAPIAPSTNNQRQIEKPQEKVAHNKDDERP
jgi:hypothetical protein